MPKDMKSRYYLNLERAIELGIITVDAPPTAIRIEGTGKGDGGSGPGGVDAPNADEERLNKFLEILPWSPDGEVGQREVLHCIQRTPGTTVPAIAAELEVSTSTVVGIINGGVQRNIDRAGFPDRKAVLDIVQQGRKWHYYPGEVLKAFGDRKSSKR